MENERTGEHPPKRDESTDGLSGESTARQSPEWAGGHGADGTAGQDADPEDLPVHETDDETTVSPENS